MLSERIRPIVARYAACCDTRGLMIGIRVGLSLGLSTCQPLAPFPLCDMDSLYDFQAVLAPHFRANGSCRIFQKTMQFAGNVFRRSTRLDKRYFINFAMNCLHLARADSRPRFPLASDWAAPDPPPAFHATASCIFASNAYAHYGPDPTPHALIGDA